MRRAYQGLMTKQILRDNNAYYLAEKKKIEDRIAQNKYKNSLRGKMDQLYTSIKEKGKRAIARGKEIIKEFMEMVIRKSKEFYDYLSDKRKKRKPYDNTYDWGFSGHKVRRAMERLNR